MSSVIAFSSKELPSLDQVGGKALALINMTREDLPVPPGFVLTVEFFKPWITALQETPDWAALQQIDSDNFSHQKNYSQTPFKTDAF